MPDNFDVPDRSPIAGYVGTLKRRSTDSGGVHTPHVVAKPHGLEAGNWRFTAPPITVTTDTVMAAAPGAGLKRYLTALQLKNTSMMAATEVVVKDGAAVIWRGYLAANMTVGENIVFPTPIAASANAALNFACVTAANVYVNAQGYTAA